MMMTEAAQKTLVLKYERKLFAFCLYLVGGDKDRAYEVCVSGCADALKRMSARDEEERFPEEASRSIFEKIKTMELIPHYGDEDLEKWRPEERQTLRIVRKAFQPLPLEDRALLLLRDQMNLSYSGVGRALGLSEGDARSRATFARSGFRKKMEDVLRQER